MSEQQHRIAAVEPVVVTFFDRTGRVLLRTAPLHAGQGFDVPRDISKRVARSETMDARGVIVDRWAAPWETA